MNENNQLKLVTSTNNNKRIFRKSLEIVEKTAKSIINL